MPGAGGHPPRAPTLGQPLTEPIPPKVRVHRRTTFGSVPHPPEGDLMPTHLHAPRSRKARAVLAGALSAVLVATGLGVAIATDRERRTRQHLAGQARHVLVGGGPGLHRVQGRRRQRQHPLGQPVLRRAVDPGRPGRHGHRRPRRAALGGRLRQGVPGAALPERHHLDHRRDRHQRHRRQPDGRRVGHRPLPAAEPHRARHGLRLLAVGPRRVRHGRRDARLRTRRSRCRRPRRAPTRR